MELSLHDIKTQLEDIGYKVEQLTPSTIKVSNNAWEDTLTFHNNDIVEFDGHATLSCPADKVVLQVMVNTLQDTIDQLKYFLPEEVIFSENRVTVTYRLYDVPTKYIIYEDGEVFSNVTDTWATIHDSFWLIRVSEMELFYVSVYMLRGPECHFRFREATKFLNEVIYEEKTVEIQDTSGERIIVRPDDVVTYRPFWVR